MNAKTLLIAVSALALLAVGVSFYLQSEGKSGDFYMVFEHPEGKMSAHLSAKGCQEASGCTIRVSTINHRDEVTYRLDGDKILVGADGVDEVACWKPSGAANVVTSGDSITVSDLFKSGVAFSLQMSNGKPSSITDADGLVYSIVTFEENADGYDSYVAANPIVYTGDDSDCVEINTSRRLRRKLASQERSISNPEHKRLQQLTDAVYYRRDWPNGNYQYSKNLGGDAYVDYSFYDYTSAAAGFTFHQSYSTGGEADSFLTGSINGKSVIVFRGSDDGGDWGNNVLGAFASLEDFRQWVCGTLFGGSCAEIGWAAEYAQCSTKDGGGQYPEINVRYDICAGHSLGGALAMHHNSRGLCGSVVTFGAPTTPNSYNKGNSIQYVQARSYDYGWWAPRYWVSDVVPEIGTIGGQNNNRRYTGCNGGTWNVVSSLKNGGDSHNIAEYGSPRFYSGDGDSWDDC